MHIEDIVLIPKIIGRAVEREDMNKVRVTLASSRMDRDIMGLIDMTVRQLQVARRGGKYFLGETSDRSQVCYPEAEVFLARMLYDLALDRRGTLYPLFRKDFEFLREYLKTEAYFLSTRRPGGGDWFKNWVDTEEAFVKNGLTMLNVRESNAGFYRTGRFGCSCSEDR